MGFAKRLKLASKSQRGFTLVELIIVIVLLGIMATGVTSFISLSTQTYINVADRDELIASARFAVERLNRELRNAVPNSVRVKNQSGFNCIEFVPTIASTVYVDIPVAPEGPKTTLSVIPFQGKDGNDYQCTGSCNDVVIVYPVYDNEVYSDPTDNFGKMFGLKSVTQTSATLWTLTLDHIAGDLFDADSPTKRIYIAKSPVTYCTFSNSLYRFDNYTIDNGVYIYPPLLPVLMAENITVVDIPFVVQNSTLQRNAQIQVKIHFLLNDENIVFNNDIHLTNTP